ncbi:hypothetical protein D2T29_00550 [Sinirhodobacter populi]|uniref:Ubiquitin-activating enzyme E1 FCCH domain-containing protein n=1 Tax=Paenirhodobacter populi TaxID=2306993 RepID=A0A443KPV2_9RHOB|nr:hypothetical protein [Sinirhodobacter populi]RWR35001.1 hypothetical protein D2T29_00550 [Sinirhodobacter populi]
MTRTTPAQRSFTSGEISPALYFRADYQRFQTGLRACRGFLPMVEGGFTRAPGTEFRGYTKNNARPRFIAFQFAANDALVLEFTPWCMRVWRYGALVMKDGAPYELWTPFGADSLQKLSWVQSADVIYLADGERPIQRLARYALDNWTIGDAVFTGPFMAQNLDENLTIVASATTGLVTLTASAALFQAGHVGTTFLLTAQHYTDISLWLGNTEMSIGAHVRYNGNIYRLVRLATGADAEANCYYVGSTKFCFVGGSVETGVNVPIHTEGTMKVNTSPDVYWQFVSDGTGIVRITGVASPTSATAQVLQNLPPNMNKDPTYRWSEGAWSSVRGWPACVEIFEQHLIAASTPSEPRTIWFSVVGDYTDFTPGVEADESFAYAVSGQASLNTIIGMREGRAGLHVFALGQEYSTRSDTSTLVISPTTTVIRMDSSHGSHRVPAVAPDGDPIFITRDQRRVIRMGYSFQDDAQRAVDLTRAASHMGADPFEEIVWQSSPQRIAWVRRAGGDLVAMIYEPDEEVIGWAVLPVAGGAVRAIAVTPAASAGIDSVLIAVERMIDGQTVCMVEELSEVHALLSGAIGPFAANHLFAAVRISSAGGVDWVSLPHLKGKEVYGWTDAGEFGPVTVEASGVVHLPQPATAGFVGLFDDTHYVETLDIQAAAPNGDTSGRPRRLKSGVGVAVLRTAQGYLRAVERDMGAPERLRERRAIIPRQTSSDLRDQFDGVASVDVNSGQCDQVSLRVEPHAGAPLTIVGLVPKVEVA